MTVYQNEPEAEQSPSGYFVLMPPKSGNDQQIDVRQLAGKIWLSKYVVLAAALLFTSVAGIHAYLYAVPIYQSQVVVAVRMDNGNAGGLGGQLNGLASLAGISIGDRSPARVEFIAVLKSRHLIEELIRRENLLPILFAEKYDFGAKRWRNLARAPTLQDGVTAFMDLCQINEDTNTGLITVKVSWEDRFVAARWTTDLITLANQQLRSSALKETQDNIGYLEKQSERVQVESVRQSIVHVLESTLNRAMMANVQKDYAFKIVDPPLIPDADKPIYPMRKIELLAGLLSGALLGMLYVLWAPSSAQALSYRFAEGGAALVARFGLGRQKLRR